MTSLTNATFFAVASMSVTSRAGRAIFKGKSGKPGAGSHIDQTEQSVRSIRTGRVETDPAAGTMAIASRKSRRSISSGSRIAVRLNCALRSRRRSGYRAKRAKALSVERHTKLPGCVCQTRTNHRGAGSKVVTASVPAAAESDEAPPIGFTMASPVSNAYLAERQRTLPMLPSLPDRLTRCEKHPGTLPCFSLTTWRAASAMCAGVRPASSRRRPWDACSKTRSGTASTRVGTRTSRLVRSSRTAEPNPPALTFSSTVTIAPTPSRQLQNEPLVERLDEPGVDDRSRRYLQRQGDRRRVRREAPWSRGPGSRRPRLRGASRRGRSAGHAAARSVDTRRRRRADSGSRLGHRRLRSAVVSMCRSSFSSFGAMIVMFGRQRR